MLDGELVVWRQGRLDFAALLARIHPARKRALVLAESLPAAYIVIDVLARKKKDLRLLSYLQRRDVLEDLLGTRLPDGLVLMPMSEGIDVARSWMLSHSDAGVEGVVAKRVDQTYRAGARRWRKVRTRITAEAVVGGVLGPVDAPDALILGRHDDRGRLRVAGRTSVLGPAVRRELALMLTPVLADRHPWPDVISSTRFGQRPPRPVEYTKVAPTLVVELDADVAFEQDRWRHAVTWCGSGRTCAQPTWLPPRALATEAVELARLEPTRLSAARRGHDNAAPLVRPTPRLSDTTAAVCGARIGFARRRSRPWCTFSAADSPNSPGVVAS